MATVAFLLPHPDDEFSISPWLADAIGAGDDVHVFYLTDGAYSGQRTDVRERESLRVLERLGLSPSRVSFLGREEALPDGRLHLHLERAHAALEQRLAAIAALDLLFVPAWEGGHQDHDATHLLGQAVASRRPGLDARQFPLYQGAGLPGPFFRVMATLPANGPTRERRISVAERWTLFRICLSYPSQWRTWMGLLPFVLLHLLLDGTLRTQALSAARHDVLPHPGRPLYERRGFLAWDEFQAATAAFRRDLA